jgi:FKBP-type peptidyl-prolyl cis-trans isomerase 2
MAQAQTGDNVTVHYRGTLDDGTEFDNSRSGEPLTFTLGKGEVIPGFDTAVTGMQTGEKKTVTIAPADAYGESQPDMVGSLERSMLPDDLDPQVGDTLELSLQNGNSLLAKVVETAAEFVVLDANHPLAGETLTFELELLSIN